MLYVQLLQNTFADICQHYVSVTYSGWQVKNEYEHRSWFSPEVQVYLVVQMANSILSYTQYLFHLVLSAKAAPRLPQTIHKQMDTARLQ